MRAPGVRLATVASERGAVGEPVRLEGRVLSFTFEEEEGKADKVTLELDNGDFALFRQDSLLGGALLEVAWGYAGELSAPRRVVVKRLSGFRVLRVEGFALSTLMDQVARTRRWENVSASDVAFRIAEEHGYRGARANVASTRVRSEVITQAAETDAQLLRRLADKEHFEFRVDAGGFAFGPRRVGALSARPLRWGSPELLSLEMESDLRTVAGAVEARGRDPLRKTTLTSRANAKTASRSTLAELVEVVDPETGQTSLQTRNATSAVRPASAATAEDLQADANAAFARGEATAVKLSAELIGDPSLAARQPVELTGVPPLLAGTYAIAACRHTLGSGGYTTSLRLARDGVGGRAAPGAAQKQGGARTRAANAAGGPELRERVDPETGESRIAYAAAGSRDPEAKR